MALTINPGVTLNPGVSATVPVYIPPPPILKSLSFNGTQGTQLDILGTTTDWALGVNGTIEWWQKTAASSTFPGGGNIDGNNAGVSITNHYGYVTVVWDGTQYWILDQLLT